MMCVPFYIIMLVLYHCTAVHLFPALSAFWFLIKNVLHKNCVSGNVVMIELTRNSPTCIYIGQNLHSWKLSRWKPHYAGTRCNTNFHYQFGNIFGHQFLNKLTIYSQKGQAIVKVYVDEISLEFRTAHFEDPLQVLSEYWSMSRSGLMIALQTIKA